MSTDSSNNPTQQPRKRGRPPKSQKSDNNNDIQIDTNDPNAPETIDLKIKLAKEIYEIQNQNDSIFKNELYKFTGNESIKELNDIKEQIMKIILHSDKDRIVTFFTTGIVACIDLYNNFYPNNDKLNKLEKFKQKLFANQKRLSPHIMGIVEKYPILFKFSKGIPIELLFFYELYSIYKDVEDEENLILKNDIIKNKYNDLF